MGSFPIKKIGWKYTCYGGTEIYFVDNDDKPIEKFLTKKSDLFPGAKIFVTTLVGDFIMTVQKDLSFAITKNGNLIATLEFDKDDRHCWTSSSVINAKSIKYLI